MANSAPAAPTIPTPPSIDVGYNDPPFAQDAVEPGNKPDHQGPDRISQNTVLAIVFVSLLFVGIILAYQMMVRWSPREAPREDVERDPPPNYHAGFPMSPMNNQYGSPPQSVLATPQPIVATPQPTGTGGIVPPCTRQDRNVLREQRPGSVLSSAETDISSTLRSPSTKCSIKEDFKQSAPPTPNNELSDVQVDVRTIA